MIKINLCSECIFYSFGSSIICSSFYFLLPGRLVWLVFAEPTTLLTDLYLVIAQWRLVSLSSGCVGSGLHYPFIARMLTLRFRGFICLKLVKSSLDRGHPKLIYRRVDRIGALRLGRPILRPPVDSCRIACLVAELCVRMFTMTYVWCELPFFLNWFKLLLPWLWPRRCT